MKISVVIPNYNGEKLMKENLPEVIKVLKSHVRKTKDEVELVVNDDGSTDTSREILKAYEGKVEGGVSLIIIYNERNYGFSTTVNRGVKKAQGEIVILLNSDVRPDEGFLEPLLTHFADEKVFAVGCMDKSVEPEGVVLRGRGIGKWERGFMLHRKGELDQNTTLWVSGGSGAFRKSIWEKLDGLNEMMNPFYWEDIDLSYRAQKSGYKVLFEKKSTVIHEHEEGAIKKTATKRKVTTTSYRNQFYFVWIDISDSSYLLSHLVWLPYHLVTALIRQDTPFLQGFTQAISHLGEVLKKRKKVQALRKVSDADVLDQFAKECR